MLKKLLLVGAIITIIPLERENQADLYMAARSTVSDITGFCLRNPAVCDKGNKAIDKLATKAEFGARLMVDIAREQTPDGNEKATRLQDVIQPQGLLRTDGRKQTGLLQPSGPQLVQSNERFPSYRNNQYSEMYGPNAKTSANANTLVSSDLQADWRGRPSR